MRKVLFIALISCLFTSCVTLNTMHYSINNQDGKGVVNDNSFNVTYPNNFTIQYNADGSCLVRNDNDSILYLDMAESYWIDLNGMAEKLYTNQVISTTTSATTGTSFNLGGAARVLGAGPGLQTLANSTVVGSSQTAGTTITQYEERYITIPPYSTASISFKSLGMQDPLIKKRGHYNYQRPSEALILSYTYTPTEPKWTMVRNQFVLDYVDVSKVNTGYFKLGKTTSGPFGTIIPNSYTKNEVNWGKWNANGWIVYGATAAALSGAAIVLVVVMLSGF